MNKITLPGMEIDLSPALAPIHDKLDAIIKGQSIIQSNQEKLIGMLTPIPPHIQITDVPKLTLADLGVKMFTNQQNFNHVAATDPNVLRGITDSVYWSLFDTTRSIGNKGAHGVVKMDGKTYVEHKFPQGGFSGGDSTANPIGSGMNSFLELVENGSKVLKKEVWVFVDVTPKDIVEYSITGKLFGVIGGNFSTVIGATGGNSVDGTPGSFRMAPKPNLDVYPYFYSHGMRSQYGWTAGHGKITTLNKEAQNRFVIRAVMNTGDNTDGIVQIWHDEKLVFTADNIKWTRPNVPVQGFGTIALATFLGGNSEQFALKSINYTNGKKPSFLQSYMGVAAGDGTRAIYLPTEQIQTPFGVIGGI